MIQVFVDRFMGRKDSIKKELLKGHPENYLSLVKMLVNNLSDEESIVYGEFDPSKERITEIDHGNYTGTLLYIVANKDYDPDKYFSIRVNYGSCSGCDTLQSIEQDYVYDWENPESSKIVTESQAEDYLTLMLHMVQSMKEV